MNKNAERGRATRERLIEVATSLFAANGYEATSIEAVLHAAGVSRGSLYHHFAGKDALFLAVLEGVGERVGAKLAAAAQDAPDLTAALRAGCLTWIRLVAEDRVVQQITLIDAPAVLGWQRWREMDEPVLGAFKAALAGAADDGRLDPGQVEVMAHILLAAVNEVTLLIARTPDPAATRAAGERAINQLLDGMLGN